MNLKARRLELGLTMNDVAAAVGVSQGTVSRWESGDIGNMRRDRLSALAHVLKVDGHELIEDETNATDFEKVSGEEKEFIDLFRSLDPSAQELVLAQIEGILRRRESGSGPHG